MKNIELSIPNMQSTHCQSRVNSVVKGIKGLEVEKLTSGKLSASIENDDVKKELIEIIEKAGYTVDRGNTESECCSTGCCG